MKSEKFHISFKLQGKSFQSVDELIDFSKTISVEVTDFLRSWFNKKDFVEVKTSGSTGKPKTIQLQKAHMINSAKATGDFFNLSEGTLALLCMSPNFIAGKMMLVRALELGWELDIVAPVSNPLNGTEKKYDFCAMVPLQVNNSLEELHKIKKLIVGGGVVSNEIIDKIQHVSTAIYATYGMTETITHIAVKNLNNFSVISSGVEKSHFSVLPNNKIPSQAENDVGVRHAEFGSASNNKIPSQAENEENVRHAELVSASYYKLLPNIKISKDNRSCLVIAAPKISSEIIITNDVVELISETEFKWLGRFDSIINSGGIKLIPEQIEEKLSSIIVNRFFVAGIPDTILGEKLILIVEVVTELSPSEVEKLKNDTNRHAELVSASHNIGTKQGEVTISTPYNHQKTESSIFSEISKINSLSKYEIPKEIYFLNQFVETSTKKINRIKTLNLLGF